MIDFPNLEEILRPNDSKIVMLVIDGLGGLSHPKKGLSELEAAHIPNLNRLARDSSCGLTIPVVPGITPGSGPGHLALFGYDPIKHLFGRGVMEALGMDVELREGDVAARANFCTLDVQGRVVDRRAGRIPSQESAALCKKLGHDSINNVRVDVYPGKDYRFAVVFRGPALSDRVSESDPQREGVPPREVTPLEPEAQGTAQVANAFIAHARMTLLQEQKANGILLRGFAQLPNLPNMAQVYKLRAAAIAAYPMYRGLAKVLGMTVLPTGATFAEEVATFEEGYSEHDFFFLHYKPADAAGEDGDFEAKVVALEEVDTYIPRILALEPQVFIIAGDHSTPALLSGHSWHPVPFLLHSPNARRDGLEAFTERECAQGSLGVFPARQIMLLALAHAQRLGKFGP